MFIPSAGALAQSTFSPGSLTLPASLAARIHLLAVGRFVLQRPPFLQDFISRVLSGENILGDVPLYGTNCNCVDFIAHS
jgi:hypothetical protein